MPEMGRYNVVMYIDIVPNRNSPPAVLLRESFREGDRVLKRTLANLSHLPVEKIMALRAVLKGATVVGTAGNRFEIVRSLPHGHVAAVLGSLKKLQLDNIIASRPCRERDLVVAMIVARIIDPCSKLATVRGLYEECCSSTLGQTLGVEDAHEDDLYAAMDWLLKRQHRIETKLSRKHLGEGSLILYDVSSSYYTGAHCELARFGHSRDRKKGFPQIIYGLLCNSAGCPVAVEVFEGNTGDPSTLGTQIRKVRKRFGLRRVVFVGDRGLITAARIRKELAPVDGLDWITALRAPAIAELVRQDAIQLSLFDKRDLAEITSPDYPGERLVVCRNPFLREERARKRESLLRATEKKLDEIVAATKRKKRRLKGKEKIALRVGKNINHYKVGKHFKLSFTEESFSYERDKEKIAQEAVLDGIYVIRTSVSAKSLSADNAVRAYKNLSKVERAFRSFKSVDLKIRPIYHRLANRVRAHVFLCMLAYYVEWHMRRLLAPVLFDDEEKELAELLRGSVVAPAKRSPGALRKAASKRAEDGGVAHSFQDLVKHLATQTKNRVHPVVMGNSESVEFNMLTTPTALQRRVFELLDIVMIQ